MTLGQKQEEFAYHAAKLILKAYELGYKIRVGDWFRDPRVHGHVGVKKSYSSANSVHKDKLAVDLNLFKDGKFLTSTEDHKELGEWWEKQHPLARWGGRFHNPDGNHYSFEHQGRK